MTGLANAANVSYNNIVVNRLIYTNPTTANLEIEQTSTGFTFHAQTTASVQLTTYVGTANDNALAQTTTNNINSYFQNLNISGLAVNFSNAVNPVPAPTPTPTPTPTPDNGGSSSNTTLIVAIVVPICVVRKECFI